MRRLALLALLVAGGCRAARTPAAATVPRSSLAASVPKPLLPPRDEVAESENGWPLALKAAAIPAREPDGWRALMSADLSAPARHDAARAAVASLRPRLAALRIALAKPTWSAPPERPDALTYQSYKALWHLAQAGVLSGQLRLAGGDPQGALEDLLAVRTLGERVRACGGPEVAYLAGTRIRAIAGRALARAAWDPAMPTALLRAALTRSVPDAADDDPALTRAMKVEFATTFLPRLAETPDPATAGDPADPTRELLRGHPHPFDREDTVRLGAEGLRAAIENASRPWAVQRNLAALGASWTEGFSFEEDRPGAPNLDAARSAAARVTNPFGRDLARRNTARLASVVLVSFRSRAEDAAVRGILLLALHAKEHRGMLPEEIPSGVTDPFSGEPFRYDRGRRVLWSVGPDGEDGDGRDVPGLSRERGDDVWPVRGLVFNDDRSVAPPVPGS